MKINLICVGKIKESFYREAVEEYAKRLSRFCTFRVIEVEEAFSAKEPNAAEIERLKRGEGERILAKVAGLAVALDRMGKEMSSEEFSGFLGKSALSGHSEISFLIGGSYGLPPEVLAKAEEKLSFGKFTYPHQLMRVIASEQIYRAFMIRSGAVYHK